MEEAMFTLCGQVAMVFVQPGGVSKKTGEEFEARDKVQILGKLPIPGGGTKLELIDLVTDDIQAFKSLHGKQIRVPVGVYAVPVSVGYFT
ncbi:hypothetical protein, partial [Pseudomonas aeruginosa]|uniref:hypothetical protein n=1 Tax=Pseudomonas aeruginosa TaxID=287 RepID=UPI000EB60CBC